MADDEAEVTELPKVDAELDPKAFAEALRVFVTEFTGYDPDLPLCHLFAQCVASQALPLFLFTG